MSIPVNQVVYARIRTTPIFPARKGFGTLLIIGESDALPVTERMRAFTGLTEVAALFGSNSDEYLAASKYFAQPTASTTLMIGRRFTADQPATLAGATDHATLATLIGVSDGSFSISIDGTVRVVTGLDLTLAASMGTIASRIQTALASQSPGATCEYLGNGFVIRSGTDGAASRINYMTEAASGTYIGALLGMSMDDQPTVANGVDAEDVATCLTNMQTYNDAWYAVILTNQSDQDVLDAAAWCETQVKMFGYSASDRNMLIPNDESSVAYELNHAGYRRTMVFYSTMERFIAVAAFALGLSVDFTQPNSAITLKFKQLSGVRNEPLSVNDKQALDALGVNYFTQFGDSAMIAEGVMSDGTFFDEVHALDALQNAIETNVFGFLYTRATKVPQTDRGVQQLVQQCLQALEQYVLNGVLAPGVWGGDEFGTLKTGDYLPNGYYIFAGSVDTQSASDRQKRIAPPIKIACKGSGAIHFADIEILFDR